MTAEEANALLPDRPTSVKPRPEGLVYLIIAPPKWGKTTWAAAFPDSILLAFERGQQFTSAHKVVVESWAGKHDIYEDEEGARHMTMEQVSEALKASDRFNTVIFDTTDMAAKSCSDYYQRKHNWQHISDGGDYGKGYDIAQNTPFRQMVGDIMNTGRGIVFITHMQVKETKFKNSTTNKKETTLPGGIHKFVHTQADCILHGFFGPFIKGTKTRTRIIQTTGDDETLAGTRTKGVNIPYKFIVDENDSWGQWSRFFDDPEAAELATLQFKSSKKAPDEDEDEDEDPDKDTAKAGEGQGETAEEAAPEPATTTRRNSRSRK